MPIDKQIFKAYDIRGNSKTNLTKIAAYNIGYHFAKKTISKNNKRFVIGYDGRHSSLPLFESLTLGINNAGGEVCSIGLSPISVLYFADKKFSPAGSIMITGSHNPSDENGFKIINNGLPFYDEDLQDLYREIKKDTKKLPDNTPKYYKVSVDDFYIKRILKDLQLDSYLKITWDNGNGAAGNILNKLMLCLEGENQIINEEINGDFPNREADTANPKNLSMLIKACKKNKSDIGFAFDGDADRLAVIDEDSNIVSSEELTCLFAKDILSRRPGSIMIADVNMSHKVLDFIKSKGGNLVYSKVGHSFVKSKIIEIKAELAVECSGHIFFKDNYFGYDDGIYSALRIIDIISRERKSLKDLISEFDLKVINKDFKIQVDEKMKFKLIDEISQFMKSNNIEFIDIDGIRHESEIGCWILRSSNTESCLRVRIQAENETNIKKVKKHLSDILKKYNLKF